MSEQAYTSNTSVEAEWRLLEAFLQAETGSIMEAGEQDASGHRASTSCQHAVAALQNCAEATCLAGLAPWVAQPAPTLRRLPNLRVPALYQWCLALWSGACPSDCRGK